MLFFLLSCADPEVEEWKCVGPLVDLVRWRDEQESQRTWGGKAIAPAELARLERERVAAIVASRESGGNYYNTKAVYVSKRFARAMIGSALEGQTPYPRAFRLLGLKKAATFDRLAERLGVL